MKLIIDNQQFERFTEFSIEMKYSAVANSFSFSGLRNFLPRPSSYKQVQIMDDGGQLLITGTIVSSSYDSTPQPAAVSLSGYSLPGVLEDCDIYNFPLQSDNLTLKEIVDKILAPFGIEYTVDSEVLTDFNKKYKKSVAGAMQTAKSYIQQLASQRNIHITNTADGKLLFTRTNANKIVSSGTFEEGNNLISSKLAVNGQAMYGPIKVMRQASSENPDAGEFEIQNPYIEVYRPKVKVLNSGDIFDMEKAARMELAAQLTNIRLNIETLEFIKAGSVIEVKNPENGINNYTRFFVEQVNVRGAVSSIRYSLSCVPEDVYTTSTPQNIFLETYNEFDLKSL